MGAKATERLRHRAAPEDDEVSLCLSRLFRRGADDVANRHSKRRVDMLRLLVTKSLLAMARELFRSDAKNPAKQFLRLLRDNGTYGLGAASGRRDWRLPSDDFRVANQ